MPKKRAASAFIPHPSVPLARGEVWLGGELFERFELEDTLANHFTLAERLDHDLVCLPLAFASGHMPSLSYRYFSPDQLNSLPTDHDLFVTVMVDGPFQTLVNRQGLMEVLMAWACDRDQLRRAYDQARIQTMQLIELALVQDIHGVIIADDLAADRAPLISPADIADLCGGFYSQAVRRIHDGGARALWHCCGNINPLTDQILTWGMDGLAGVQQGVNDLARLSERLGHRLTILGGIDGHLLDGSSTDLTGFEDLVRSLAPAGNLILGSCCGLYSEASLDRLTALYDLSQTLTAHTS